MFVKKKGPTLLACFLAFSRRARSRVPATRCWLDVAGTGEAQAGGGGRDPRPSPVPVRVRRRFPQSRSPVAASRPLPASPVAHPPAPRGVNVSSSRMMSFSAADMSRDSRDGSRPGSDGARAGVRRGLARAPSGEPRRGRVRNAPDPCPVTRRGLSSGLDPDPHGMPSQIYSFKHLTDVVAVSVMGGTQAARAAPAPGRSRRSLSARQYPVLSLVAASQPPIAAAIVSATVCWSGRGRKNCFVLASSKDPSRLTSYRFGCVFRSDVKMA